MSINITVEEFSTPDPISVKSSATLTEMKYVMQSHGIRHVLVLDEESQALAGIVSERDIGTFSSSAQFSDLMAKDIMSSEVLSVSPETKLYDVALQMSQNKYGSAIVVDHDQNPLGIFTDTDALNAIVEILRGDMGLQG